MSHDGFGLHVNMKATFSELKESLDHLERTVSAHVEEGQKQP